MEDTFKITNDKTADWAITQIHEAENERDRLLALAEDQIKDLTNKIEELKTKCDNETAFLRSCLAEYFETVPSKETKTQKTYKLLSGTLVFKKPTVKVNHNDEQLIEFCNNDVFSKYIKTKKSIDWAEFKKNIEIFDDCVISTETGEIISACSIEDVPASFNIKY